jgi:2-polyprenyl-3-methyl-5-hydroxy-6-metoxy-1,4-benzoquinol methylase
LLPDYFVGQWIHPGARVVSERPLTVSTPAAQWAYALSGALPPRATAANGGIAETTRFTFDVSVIRGRIGVGWTSVDGQSFVTERVTSRVDTRISFVLQVGDKIGLLVFRNVDPSGESEFIIRNASVEALSDTERRYPVSVSARDYAGEESPTGGETLTTFDTDAALAINRARVDWLQGARLPIERSRVLDAGCGVGHFIPFYAAHGCSVVAVDARSANIEELRRRFPQVDARVADLQRLDHEAFGFFDVIHCFGLLYHLDSPIAALHHFNAMCRGLLILETMVCDSSRPVSVLVDETKAASQAIAGLGSRPSPAFVALALNRVGFDYVYAAATPPDHPDFQFAWCDNLETMRNGTPLRCVFVASRVPLLQPSLVPLVES